MKNAYRTNLQVFFACVMANHQAEYLMDDLQFHVDSMILTVKTGEHPELLSGCDGVTVTPTSPGDITE